MELIDTKNIKDILRVLKPENISIQNVLRIHAIIAFYNKEYSGIIDLLRKYMKENTFSKLEMTKACKTVYNFIT